MKSKLVWILGAIAVVVGGGLAYLYFAGGSGEPSTQLTTPPLAAATSTTAGDVSTTEGTAPVTTGGSSSVQAFVIDPAQSSASFEIDEVLRGSPKRVVGTTSELAGQVQVDPAAPATLQFSQIVVNARTFETDSGNRDRAIRGPVVLNSASDEFEFITFDVTAVEGLSDPLLVGEEVTFSVTGDLLIRETVNPVTFEVTASMIDDVTIEGSAVATVLRSDYGIGIPQAPGVADVGDEVVIRLDFVAGA
jgi:polyisoprenoid-binding protein YceI